MWGREQNERQRTFYAIGADWSPAPRSALRPAVEQFNIRQFFLYF